MSGSLVSDGKVSGAKVSGTKVSDAKVSDAKVLDAKVHSTSYVSERSCNYKKLRFEVFIQRKYVVKECFSI